MFHPLIFNNEATELVALAKDEATQRKHGQVTALHLLLAAVKNVDSYAAKLLAQFTDLPTFQKKIEVALAVKDVELQETSGGYSERYGEALEFANRESKIDGSELISPVHIFLGIRSISGRDGCGFFDDVFNASDLRAIIVCNRLEAINTQLSELQKAVGIDTPEEAIAEAVRRLKVDAEQLPLLHELRSLLSTASDADALVWAIGQAQNICRRSDNLVSAFQSPIVSTGY